VEQVKVEFSWDEKGRRWYSFGEGKRSDLLPGHGVSLEAASGTSPGPAAGTAWQQERRSGPGGDGGCRICLLFTLSPT